MYEFKNEMERNTAIVLIVNSTRTVVYIIVMLAYIQDFIDKGLPYNAMNFLVPAYLAILDIAVISLRFANRRRFWNVVPIVSIIAILISGNTMLGVLQHGGVTFLQESLLYLGLLVFILSLFELIGWIKEEAELVRAAEMGHVPSTSEFRTY